MPIAWPREASSREAAPRGMAARRAAATPGRARGRPMLLLSAPLLALLLLACGGSGDEPDREPATVAAAGGGVTTATPTPTEPPAPSIEDEAIAAWGSTICGVTDAFALDYLASGDPRDPTELELQPRKDRAAAMFPTQHDAVREASSALEDVEPPRRTAELHRLLLATYYELGEALEEQEQLIAQATTTDEIAASNLLVDQLLDLTFRQATLLLNAGYCQ